MTRLPMLCAVAACGPGTAHPADFSACRAEDSAPYSVGGADTGGATEDVRVDGDTLSVMLGHSGGCGDHWYALCWPDRSFLESDPVQANLEVYHGSNDGCDAYFFETVPFDLSPLRRKWRLAYGDENGTILLQVAGAPDALTYDF